MAPWLILSFSLFLDCTVRTTDNKCCVFPFLYEGERQFTCASSFFGGKWCATTYNYDEDEEWGECLGLFQSIFRTPTQVDRRETKWTSSKTGAMKFKCTSVLIIFLLTDSVARDTFIFFHPNWWNCKRSLSNSLHISLQLQSRTLGTSPLKLTSWLSLFARE